MTPLQALQLVDQVLQNVSGTRNDHEKIKEAVRVLAEAVSKDAPQVDS